MNAHVHPIDSAVAKDRDQKLWQAEAYPEIRIAKVQDDTLWCDLATTARLHHVY